MVADDIHLVRSTERVDEIEALAERVGGRVGLAGVLDDLNRRARRTRIPGPAATWGFTWDIEDARSRRWWPQGITTSADQGDPGRVDGREVVVTSAYSRTVDDLTKGSRLSFVDVTERGTLRYRHVLLVEAYVRGDGRVDVRPVKVHAGGIVWHGAYLHVAGTARGISTVRLDDIIRVPAIGDRSRLGVRDDGGIDSFGYRYLLPVRFTYDARAADGHERLRYSFLSLDRGGTPPSLVAGEYGRGEMTTRLVRYELDPATSLLRAGGDGTAYPLGLDPGGVPGMQGAAVVGGTYYVTTSNGRLGRGSLWVGRPGALRRFDRVLPAGCEDLAYAPATDQLWCLTEYPWRRYVFAMDRARFAG